MQEAAFAAARIKAYYLPVELDSKHFHKLMQKMAGLLLDGFNITVPYKEEIIGHLDALTPEAKAVKAVNTVFRKGRRWIGANTDVYGFLTSLVKEGGFHPKNKRVLIMGAGGGARAVAYALASAGAVRIQIANRHTERARHIAREFKKIFPKVNFEIIDLKSKNRLKAALENSELVVNATSLGLKSNDLDVFPASLIPRAGKGNRILFFDLIYRRAETPFLKNAKRRGHKTLGGLGMLLFQGARAFEYWTGKIAPVDVMRKALFLSLRKE